ncbi:MAG: hypothetical protein VW683_05380 [Betaproteobacteria bacterium]
MPTVEEFKTQFQNENPTLTKIVDGKTITLTSEEYEQTINEWAQGAYEHEREHLILEDGGASVHWAQYRIDAYGSIGDQLDMQYHDSVNGTTTWQDHIAAVKAKYPKP